MYQWDRQELLKEHGHLQEDCSESLAERQMERNSRLFAHRKGEGTLRARGQEDREKAGSFVLGMEMLHVAFPFCVQRDIGIWSGLTLGHLPLAHAEAEALELGSAPSHIILHFFAQKWCSKGSTPVLFPSLSSLHCKYISNVESGIYLSFSSFISVHF